MTKTQETPATAEPERPTHHLCQSHGTYFPKEDPWRPVSEWSVNAVTLMPLRNKCKWCDAATKTHYSKRKQATTGPLLVENLVASITAQQKILDDLDASGEGDSFAAEQARKRLVYLEWQLAQQDGATS
jgi:hypothetical protein